MTKKGTPQYKAQKKGKKRNFYCFLGNYTEGSFFC
jgi:hypothetical protein